MCIWLHLYTILVTGTESTSDHSNFSSVGIFRPLPATLLDADLLTSDPQFYAAQTWVVEQFR